jgi:hypothetical protein
MFCFWTSEGYPTFSGTNILEPVCSKALVVDG